jgi:hypothetical protein
MRWVVATKIRVAVYGRSLYMAGIATSLNANPALEVVRIDPNSPAAGPALDELAPAVIAFDLVESPSDLALKLLRDRPGLLLIGVDPSSDHFLVLSGQQTRAEATTDLVHLILGGRADYLPIRPLEN